MGRRIVLLRHGQTDWNATHRIQGQLDSELNEVGIQQAAAVAPVIAALSPSLLWTSDLRRATLTADVVAGACGLVPVSDKRLREYTLGSLEGLTHAELLAQDPAAFAEFRAGNWEAVDQIEPPDEVAARVVGCLTDLVDALPAGAVGVAVAHGAAIRTGMVAWLGWPPQTAGNFRALTNCARVELDEREDGSWAIAGYNLVA